MNIDAKSSPTIADAPFNDPTDNVDLVIRTADNVDFFVLSALLSLRSPSSFFRHALRDNWHTEERDGLPVLDVLEDSVTFLTILLFCYPDVVPEPKSVQQFQAVGLALEKYCMDHAMERFVQAVLASSMISEQPLRVFTLAVANGWRVLGEAAARNTLAMPLNHAISDVEELKTITGHHLYRLQDYHTRCGKAAQTKITAGSFGLTAWLRGNTRRKTSNLRFIHSCSGPHNKCDWCGSVRIDCLGNAEGQMLHGHSWLVDTYFRLVNAKVFLEPHPQVALDDHIIDQALIASVRQCSDVRWAEIAGSQIRLLGKIVAEEINERISEAGDT